MTDRIGREHYIFDMNKAHPPALSTLQGANVQFQTYDAFLNQITSEDSEMTTIDWEKVNPATGPLYVKGTKPGDILQVDIERILFQDEGTIVTGEELGAMGHRLEGFSIKKVKIANNNVHLNDTLTIPVHPMIGVIGVAPANEGVPCGTPDAHGGNMDTRLITEGATVHFPVFQEGALLAMGDVHAAMGDGEVCVSGVEVSADITVNVDAHQRFQLNYPLLENKEGIATLVSKKTLDEAATAAVEEMVELLISLQPDLTIEETTMVLSAAGSLEISQVVDPLKTCRCFINHEVLEGLGIDTFN
ncbi:amidase [Geomicrobium halophilum]|uniref:Amidase n=1 Tax=Geomicrobium halophilum TaxID=549000 RepID=A0A841Q012_9BACL|nr:acetamidase/formamidase family protein [Geomicrobium halophilum]MBB6448528.1 amidase [Geomicrobium halophilum]